MPATTRPPKIAFSMAPHRWHRGNFPLVTRVRTLPLPAAVDRSLPIALDHGFDHTTERSSGFFGLLWRPDLIIPNRAVVRLMPASGYLP